MTPPTPKEVKKNLEEISRMSHYDMCALWRFAPAGHPYFDCTLPYVDAFKKRLFDELGGFTPEISKSLGWE
jgi:hypothetical protein